MQLRKKYLLSALSLIFVPLGLLFVVHINRLRDAGDTMARQAGHALTRIAVADLEHSAKNYANSMHNTAGQLELVLEFLAKDIQAVLAGSPELTPESTQGFISSSQSEYIAAALNTAKQHLKHTVHSMHITLADTGREQQPAEIWFSTSSGQQLPANALDLRTRPWFSQAVRSSQPRWFGPFLHSISKKPVYTITRALTSSGNSIQGVISFDVLVDTLLHDDQLKPHWASQTHYFLVKKEPAPTPQLTIIAQKKDPSGPESTTPTGRTAKQHWQISTPPAVLTSQQKGRLRFFISGMQPGTSGFASMSYDGRESLWVYSCPETYEIGQGIYAVLILPASALSTLPQRAKRLIHTEIEFAILTSALAALGIILLVTAIAIRNTNKSVKPLLAVADMAKRLASGDFTAHLDMKTGDETDLVIATLNEAGPRLADHLRIHQAMDVAARVQHMLLPQNAPDLPGFDIFGISVYCDETGGDYFDYFPLVHPAETRNDKQESGQYAIVIGDVSGHGIGPALLMASARANLRAFSLCIEGLAQRITQVNTQLVKDLFGTGLFMSLFAVDIDYINNRIHWVRAGHEPALLYDPATGDYTALQGEGMVLGVLEQAVFEAQTLEAFPAGGILVLGTDGIWEAADAQGNLYGLPRLKKMIARHAEKSAQQISNAILHDIHTFTGNNAAEDDITLVIIRHTGIDSIAAS